MCTRTKTSYGCGHTHKSDVECRSRACSGLERYCFQRPGDCRECKQGGNSVTRGKDGMGRYAQELKQREVPPPVARRPLSPISTNTKASPWAPPKPREREWHSPVRQAADDAWLIEHAKRERDLEAKSQENSSRSSHSTPTKDYAREQRRREEEAARLVGFRKLENAERIRVRSRAARSDSYGSYDSMDSSRTPPRGRSYSSSFGSSPSPYVYQVSPYHGLGHGLETIIRDSTRKYGQR